MKAQLTAATLGHRFARRSFVIGGLQGGIGLLLAARMGYLAVAENERYRTLSESNVNKFVSSSARPLSSRSNTQRSNGSSIQPARGPNGSCDKPPDA